MRILLILGPFLLAIGGLVYLQTGMFEAQGLSSWNTDAAQVSEPEIELTDVRDVIARLPQDSPATFSQAVEESVAEASDPDGEMKSLTNSVLSGLGVQVAATQTPAAAPLTEQENELRSLTSAVLAGLGGLPETNAGEAPAEDHSLAGIIAQAIQQGQSDSYVDTLVNAAASAGKITVPAAYMTAEGRVDTGSLITELTRSVNGEVASATPNSELIGGRGVEVRVVQEGGATVQHNFYTVQAGDSLGGISQLFYGDAGLYIKIYEANRRLLSSPNRIRAGQRLTIPAFSAT